MKTNYIISSLIALSMIMTSCKKFLDIPRGNGIAFIETVEDCQLVLDDYDKMNTGYPYDGEISADDYFILDATLNAASTSISPEEKNFYLWLPAAQRALAETNWQKPYQIISISNFILENLERIGKEGGDQAAINKVKGAALFFRAFSFWQIAQIYTKPYSAATAAQNPGIPLRLTSNVNDKSSRGTVQDTYARILQDLTEASTLLPNTSMISSRPNKAAAYAMLARTYMSMRDYPKALINANAALGINSSLLDYNDLNKATPLPFVRFNNVEVIFHSVCARSNILNGGSASLSTAKVDRELAASYATDDLRRQIFLKPNSGAHTGTFRFSGNYEPAVVSTFFNGLAVDELYLIKAECNARAGNTEVAMEVLNDLLDTRWVEGTYVDMDATTSDEALTIILQERRKELLFRGLRWSDLRRLNQETDRKKDLERKVDGNGAVKATLPANDPRYTLLIPADVITIGGIAQNTR